MRKFTKETLSKLYISPYASFHMEEDAVIIRQHIFGRRVRILGCTSFMLEVFIKSFQDGQNEDDAKEQLSTCFPGSDPEELLIELMRAGVLE